MTGLSSSGELYVLNKIVNLQLRCGMCPVDSEIGLHWNSSDSSYDVIGTYVSYADGDEREKIQDKVYSLLGFDGGGKRTFHSLEALNDVVDHALSLLPRARIR